jgi:hypothetical protein
MNNSKLLDSIERVIIERNKGDKHDGKVISANKLIIGLFRFFINWMRLLNGQDNVKNFTPIQEIRIIFNSQESVIRLTDRSYEVPDNTIKADNSKINQGVMGLMFISAIFLYCVLRPTR